MCCTRQFCSHGHPRWMEEPFDLLGHVSAVGQREQPAGSVGNAARGPPAEQHPQRWDDCAGAAQPGADGAERQQRPGRRDAQRNESVDVVGDECRGQKRYACIDRCLDDARIVRYTPRGCGTQELVRQQAPITPAPTTKDTAELAAACQGLLRSSRLMPCVEASADCPDFVVLQDQQGSRNRIRTVRSFDVVKQGGWRRAGLHGSP